MRLVAKRTDERIRPAQRSDHAAFVRLFPELAVDDPVANEENFTEKLVPSMLVLEAANSVVGYTYFQILKETAYVRHVVTAPDARRKGVGRALLEAVLERAREAKCTNWCLNVKPDNVAAIALYESLGLTRAFTSEALKVDWSIAEGGERMHDAGVSARLIDPTDDARVEAAMNLVGGQLANARAAPGARVLMALHGDDGSIEGATIFDPSFPGAYPFRVARPELALVLLRALRPSARPADTNVSVVIEGQPEVAASLRAAGATLKLHIQHMKGPVPAT